MLSRRSRPPPRRKHEEKPRQSAGWPDFILLRWVNCSMWREPRCRWSEPIASVVRLRCQQRRYPRRAQQDSLARPSSAWPTSPCQSESSSWLRPASRWWSPGNQNRCRPPAPSRHWCRPDGRSVPVRPRAARPPSQRADPPGKSARCHQRAAEVSCSAVAVRERPEWRGERPQQVAGRESPASRRREAPGSPRWSGRWATAPGTPRPGGSGRATVRRPRPPPPRPPIRRPPRRRCRPRRRRIRPPRSWPRPRLRQ